MAGFDSAIQPSSRPEDEILRPLAFLGIGLYWAWVYMSFFSTTLFPHAGNPTGLVNKSLTLSLMAAMLMILMWMLIASRTPPKSENGIVFVAAIVASVGTALTAAGTGQSALFIAGSIMTGLGTGTLLVQWGRLYGSIDARRAGTRISLSLFLSILICLAVVGLPSDLAIGTVVVLPMISMATLLFAKKGLLPSPSAPTGTSLLHFPWKLALGLSVCGAAFGFVMGLTFLTPSTIRVAGNAVLVANGAVALTIMIVMAFMAKELNYRLAYRVVLPLMGLGFLLLPLFGAAQRPLAFALARGGYTFFDVLIWIQLSAIAFETRTSVLRIFCGFRLALDTGVLVGVIAGLLLAQTILPFLTVVSIVIVFLLIVILTLVLSETNVERAWGLLNKSDPEAISRWTIACDALASAHHLSPREAEVMVLIAKGRSAPRIADELGVSTGTVQTHSKNLYRKLGIHSRQSLLILIEEERQRDH